MSLDLNPENPDVWLNKGIAHLNSGNTDAACYDFRKAYLLGNQRAAAYINSNCMNQQATRAVPEL
jgi:Flp pilus assembly protein TadD